MAAMPRGEPRSVPDPAGEKYDEMLRQERLKRQRAEAARAGTVTIGSQVYREIDNGRANVLVPAVNPYVSPAELADRRRVASQALSMAEQPLAGVAYGLATLAQASPQVRDGLMAFGSVADSALQGFVPRGVSSRKPTTPPRRDLLSPTLQRDSHRLGGLSTQGQASRSDATLTASLLGTGSKAKRAPPPGWRGNGRTYNEARAHLVAASLGGSGGAQNIVTMTHNGVNNGLMSRFEGGVRDRVRTGEVIEYSAVPLYGKGALPPSAVLLTAFGSRQQPIAKVIMNPAGRPR